MTLGAGLTAAIAESRARAEMGERRAGFFRGTEPRIRASLGELGDSAIHPGDCLLYSDRQHRIGPAPVRLSPNVPVEWAAYRSVVSGRRRWVPATLTWYRHPDRRFGRADSNGVAAGPSRARAARRGLLELIERDSVALWWYNRARRPGLDLSRGASWVRRLLGWYDRIGRDCWALDLTSDLGVPVVAAISRRRSVPEEIVLGFGADPRWSRAQAHALLEMTQLLAVAEGTSQGRLLPPPATRRWLRRARSADHPYLLPAPRGSRSSPAFGAKPAAGFERLAAGLARRGLEVLAADLTRARSPREVVRIVVPGLRPWWPRFAPGRLYRAPVAAGWRARPLPESALNPHPFFL